MDNKPNNALTLLIIALAALGIVIAIVLAFALYLWPAWVLLWLGMKKYWILLIIFVLAMVLYQTVKYRNVDIFADSCGQNIERNHVKSHLNDAEWMEAMFAGNGQPFTKIFSSRVFTYKVALLAAPHNCLCNPCTFYSEDRKYKATVYHRSWKSYGLFQDHQYEVIYDRNVSKNA